VPSNAGPRVPGLVEGEKRGEKRIGERSECFCGGKIMHNVFRRRNAGRDPPQRKRGCGVESAGGGRGGVSGLHGYIRKKNRPNLHYVLRGRGGELGSVETSE